MKQILATSFLLLACSTANVHAETIVLKPGDYKVTTAKTLTFDGQTIELASIDAPLPGQMCILRGREHDCGVIARSQLMDLTIAATVTCSMREHGSRCATGGFDIAAQMVYTGWAVPGKNAPVHYLDLKKNAQEKSRGFWRAKFTPQWGAFAKLTAAD